MTRAGWTRKAPEFGTKGATYTHTASGWRVRHCGGNCAHYPYALLDPANRHALTVSHNGKGFPRLELALDVVEAILAGTWFTTGERCTAQTRVALDLRRAADQGFTLPTVPR